MESIHDRGDEIQGVLTKRDSPVIDLVSKPASRTVGSQQKIVLLHQTHQWSELSSGSIATMKQQHSVALASLEHMSSEQRPVKFQILRLRLDAVFVKKNLLGFLELIDLGARNDW